MIEKKFSYSPPLQHKFFSFIRTEYSIAFTIYLLVYRLLAKLAFREGEPGVRPVHPEERQGDDPLLLPLLETLLLEDVGEGDEEDGDEKDKDGQL
jgi:hypothetical protein